MTDERLKRGLEEIRIPDEDGARERARRLVEASHHVVPRRERRGPLERRGVQLAIALGLLLAVAISPAGAAVRDWVGDAVEDGHDPALPALTSLPAPGPLLVDSAQGPWIVHPDGSKRLLGSYAESTWSPRGLFVAATGDRQLAALDPLGEVRWTVSRPRPSHPAWSTDGYRIAYLSGAALRVVAGDGTGDRVVAAGAAPVSPAWQPGPGHLVTFAEAEGGVRTIDADSGATSFRSETGVGPTSLSWSPDGARLLLVEPSELTLLDRGGDRVWRRSAPRGTRFAAAVPAGDPARVAAIVTAEGRASRSELLLFGPGGRTDRVFAGPGRFSGVTASPDGRWLLLEWESADQWLFLDVSRPQRLLAISDIAAQFAPGATSPTGFPEVAGWCCRGPLAAGLP